MNANTGVRGTRSLAAAMPVGAPASGRKPFTTEVESRGTLSLVVLFREEAFGQAVAQSFVYKLLLHHDFGTMSVCDHVFVTHMLLT